jgi:hypothetical protein
MPTVEWLPDTTLRKISIAESELDSVVVDRARAPLRGVAIIITWAVGSTRVTKNPQPGLVHRGRCGRHRNPLYWLKKNIHDGYAFVNGLCRISQSDAEFLYKADKEPYIKIC